jgi:hypothetical protein
MTPISNRRVPDPSVKLECRPRKYRSRIGLEFWYDHKSRAIVTNDPATSINFVHASRGMDSVMFVYLKLDEISVQIAQKSGKPFPPSVYRGPNYSTVWVIGSLGMPLYYHSATRGYRSLGEHDFEIIEVYEPIAIDRGFSSKKQQSAAVSFITDALQRYNGEWIGACRGEEQQAEVCIRPELEDQLANGALLLR